MDPAAIAAQSQNYDIRHVAKTHFIIYARQFIEEFAEYFEDCPAIQQVKIMFLALYNDVPTGLDPEEFTELLYKFTPDGDERVTFMLNNFGKFIQPYKSFIEQRDASIWAKLASLPKAQNNLIQQLDIANKWVECDLETREVIWEYVEKLVYYGSMYTTYGQIPSSMMDKLNQCALEVIENKAKSGKPLTQEDVQQSMTEIAPKILASISQQEMMTFAMDMAKNPSMMQDLMGMAKNAQDAMPGFNASSMLDNMMPGGMAGMQQMMATLSGGGGGGGMPQMTAAQIAQAQSMMAAMVGGGGGSGGNEVAKS